MGYRRPVSLQPAFAVGGGKVARLLENQPKSVSEACISCIFMPVMSKTEQVYLTLIGRYELQQLKFGRSCHY